ncbi:hypothetical protein AB0A60_14040 [Streptomyces sp. NPDC046275]|uniref:hypothetical protein n=1 Tax=Streptomyces sp. NPDC046275 TaxID=3157201 RepID=UPI0033C13F3C
MAAYQDDIDEPRITWTVELVDRGGTLDDHLHVAPPGFHQIAGQAHQALRPGGALGERGVGLPELPPPCGQVRHHEAPGVERQQILRCQFQQEHGHEVVPPGHE